MSDQKHQSLSRREREIMNVIYRLGKTDVWEVKNRLSDNPSYDTVRVLLGILFKKGFLDRYKKGRRYIYQAITPKEKAARTAIRNLLATFFSGSPSKAVLSMLDESAGKLTQEEIDEIKARIEEDTD